MMHPRILMLLIVTGVAVLALNLIAIAIRRASDRKREPSPDEQSA